MKFVSKTLLIISLITVFLISARQSFAQYPGMGAVYRQMNTQMMNQQMGMMRMNGLNHFTPGVQNEYTYVVKFKNGTIENIKSFIFIDTTRHKSYLLVVNKKFPKSDTAHRNKKVFVDQTISIARELTPASETDSIKATYFTGNATDSCWMFKSVTGHINLYSFESEDGDSNMFDPSTVVGIQIDNGPIKRFVAADLKDVIASDEKAMKYYNKKNYLKAITKYNSDNEK